MISYLVFQVRVLTITITVNSGLVSVSVQKTLYGCFTIVQRAAKCVQEYPVSNACINAVVTVPGNLRDS